MIHQRTYSSTLLTIETGAQGEKAPLISLPRSTAWSTITTNSKNTASKQTQMPSAAQIVSLVTFFEISQRKSLGYRASPVGLVVRLNLVSKTEPASRVPPDAILIPRQQKYAKVPSPSGGHILSPVFGGFNKCRGWWIRPHACGGAYLWLVSISDRSWGTAVLRAVAR